MPEKMTREELRIALFQDGPFCGCGSPEDACQALLDLLRIHPLYEHQEELAALAADSGQTMILLYLLDSMGLTEHGGTVEGGWLTAKGQAVLAALKAEADDCFEALTETHCIHGYDFDDHEHDCMKAGDPKPWRQKVYIVERGVYADRMIVGIYSSAEKAKESRPGDRWSGVDDYFTNGLDMDRHAEITEYELDD